MKTTFISKLSLLSLFAAITFASCSKNDNSLSQNTSLLIDKGWKFEKYGLDENNNAIIDETENAMQTCEIDDIFTFNLNGTGSLDHGSTECSPGDPAISNFNWSFSNNETELAIFGAPEKISIMNNTILEVYYMDQNLQGQPVKYIRRFHH